MLGLAAVALALGIQALPAAATTWPPGVVYRSTYNGCVADITSGDFGQSFANAESLSGCSEIQVRIKAVVPTGSGVGTSPWCSLTEVLFHPGGPTATWCSFLFRNGIPGVQAHLPGSIGWLETDFRLCGSSACSSTRVLTLL